MYRNEFSNIRIIRYNYSGIADINWSIYVEMIWAWYFVSHHSITTPKVSKLWHMYPLPTCYHQPLCHRGRAARTLNTTTNDCASVGAGRRTDHNQTQLRLSASCRAAREDIDTVQVVPTS